MVLVKMNKRKGSHDLSLIFFLNNQEIINKRVNIELEKIELPVNNLIWAWAYYYFQTDYWTENIFVEKKNFREIV